MNKLVNSFIRNTFRDDPKSARVYLRLHPEQSAAYEEGARLAGYDDVSSWVRHTLDIAARGLITGEKK